MSSTSPAKRSSSPLPFIVLGLVLILFWVLASLLQIQTSEAFILHGAVVSFIPNWSILMQPVNLVQGHLSPDMAKATMWGWGNELIFLVCIIGYDMAHESVKGSHKRLAHVFQTGAIALIIFNGYMDYQYGNLASGLWGQLAFALITAFMVMFFGTVGLRFLEHGFTEFSH